MKIELREVDEFIPEMLAPDFGLWVVRPPLPDVHPLGFRPGTHGLIISPLGIAIAMRKISSPDAIPDGVRRLLVHSAFRENIPLEMHSSGTAVFIEDVSVAVGRPPVLPQGLHPVLGEFSGYQPVLSGKQRSIGIPLGFGKWTTSLYSQPESRAGEQLPGFCLECGRDLAALAGMLLRLSVRRAPYERSVAFLDALVFDVLDAPPEVRRNFLVEMAAGFRASTSPTRISVNAVVQAMMNLGLPRTTAWQLLEGAQVLAGVADRPAFRALLERLGIRMARNGERLLPIPAQGGEAVLPFWEAMQVLSRYPASPPPEERQMPPVWRGDFERLNGQVVLLLSADVRERRGSFMVFPCLLQSQPDGGFVHPAVLRVREDNLQFASSLRSGLQMLTIQKAGRVAHIRSDDPPPEIDFDWVEERLQRVLALDSLGALSGGVRLFVRRVPVHRMGAGEGDGDGACEGSDVAAPLQRKEAQPGRARRKGGRR